MAKRKKEKRTYKYECSLTGEKYVLTEKTDKVDELVSVKAYYEMHPEKDDRPADIKKKLGVGEEVELKVEKEEEEENN